MTEDYRFMGNDRDYLPVAPEHRHRALRYIDRTLQRQGRSLADFPHMVVPPAPAIDDVEDNDVPALDLSAHQQLIQTLNVQQHENYDILIEAIASKRANAFFLDCPGGTGICPRR
jgi:hypothetical protein